MGITLVPKQADIVAVLETDSERVGLGGSVVLRADKSYDADHVQVCLQSAISAHVFPMKIKSCPCQTKLYWFHASPSFLRLLMRNAIYVIGYAFSHVFQTDFNYVWSCRSSRALDTDSHVQNCTNANGHPLKLDVYNFSTIKLEPWTLNLRTDTVYEFQVVVWADASKSNNTRFGKCKNDCYLQDASAFVVSFRNLCLSFSQMLSKAKCVCNCRY